MLEQLSEPIVVTSDFGPVTLTHRCWGFTHQPWNTPELLSYAALGVVDPVTGKFKPFPGREQQVGIDGDDYKKLLAPTDAGKPANQFRTDDIIAIHKERAAKAEAAARAAVEKQLAAAAVTLAK